MHGKVSELQQVFRHVAKHEHKRGGKWKRLNPDYWETKYGLIDMSIAYYQRRKQLYAALYEHPVNAMT